MPTLLPTVPETITVHLAPPDTPAANVRVSFPAYIKNVASSEIFPTWPENALRANIYAQVTFALNRVYTEYYSSRGYDFDITSSTAFDQSFIPGRDIFENVSRIVDELFNDYVVRRGFVEPLFTQYCDGERVSCRGLSQWGTVTLARQGLIPYAILQYYYGENIDIIFDAPIGGRLSSFPPAPLSLGDNGNDVLTVQIRLNRVSVNYPAIPRISDPDGFFDAQTENAVRAFQRIFDLDPDGIVGKATWYRLQYVYDGIKGLNELDSEGLTYGELATRFPEALREGDQGIYVSYVQFFLAYVARFLPTVPRIAVDGIFGPKTREAVEAFQAVYALPQTGEVEEETFSVLQDVYTGLVRETGTEGEGARPYPGRLLVLGSRGEEVAEFQTYLARIARSYPVLPALVPDGVFGEETLRAVRLFQEMNGIPVSGVVGALTWTRAGSLYDDLLLGEVPAGVFPGETLQEEEEDDAE